MRSAVLALLMLSACPANPCQSGGGEPELTLGTGVDSYENMPAELELIHGPQGGYHLGLAFRIKHMAGDELIAGTVTAAIGGEERASSSPWLDMVCGGGALESAGTNLIFADDFAPEEAIGNTVAIAATFRDLDGNNASTMVDVQVIDTVDENPEDTGQ